MLELELAMELEDSSLDEIADEEFGFELLDDFALLEDDFFSLEELFSSAL